jgi:hypothetical protein
VAQPIHSVNIGNVLQTKYCATTWRVATQVACHMQWCVTKHIHSMNVGAVLLH